MQRTKPKEKSIQLASRAVPFWLLAASFLFSGCVGTTEESTIPIPAAGTSADNTDATVSKDSTPAATSTNQLDLVELDGDALASAQLSESQLNDGWVRLFDNQSLFGWIAVGDADWKIVDGAITVSKGERSYLCTSFQISDFELSLEFQSDTETNSGVFLRTGPTPGDVATESLELNIAPPDNPFPTGSFVQRQRVEPETLGEFDPTQWHTYHIRLVGNQIDVSLDGKNIISMTDDLVAATGHISLQHNAGRVAFRNIVMRPIHFETLATGEDWEKQWDKQVKEDAALEVSGDESGLHLVGGLGQLQSKADYDNFFLHATYTLKESNVNSGIFFRCIRDAILDGYECQVNHAILNNDPMQPGDAGAGAIFRRQPARIVLGDGLKTTHVSVLANGSQISTWVGGVQVVDFQDTRPADVNPRRGLRVEGGPISLQGHDPSTDVTFHSIEVSSLGK